MHYFIHIMTDSERIQDPEGQEFADLEAARAEASQSARDLMAGELTAGRPVPFGWQAQIADRDGAVVMTIAFAALVFGDDHPRQFRAVTEGNAVERAKAITAKAMRINRELGHGLGQLWSQVRTLARINASLGSM